MATALGSPTRSCGAYRAAESRGGYVFSWPAMPQDPLYHQFADRRSILGIANGLNVLSNIPFLLVGIAGCRAVLASARRSALHAQWLMWPYLALFFGTALTAIGSGYYHLAAQLLVDPLLRAGLASAIYWYATERIGHGDLRPYLLVQDGSLALIMLLLHLYPARLTFYAAPRCSSPPTIKSSGSGR